MMMKSIRISGAFAFSMSAVMGLCSLANAVTIGPGRNITDATDVDTPGQERLNVDRTEFVTLQAGTFNIDEFGLNVVDHTAGIAGAGTVSAMLLIGSPTTYTTLWVSPALDPTSNGVQSVAYASGTQQFTLGAATNVFAGLFTENQGSGIVGLDADNSGSGFSQTAHDSSFTAPTGAGQNVSGFSNPNLARTYAFDLQVTTTAPPETPNPSAGGLIGVGAGAMGGLDDGTGGRTNVEQDFMTLAAGTYNVTDFEFWAVNTDGTVLPFLATRSTAAPDQRYTPIWVGDEVTPGAAGLITDLVNEQFTLDFESDVYAGFVMSENAVGYANGGATDHNGAPVLVPTAGVQLKKFSNNNLGRTYSFGINVQGVPPVVVPEPATATLAMLGLGGLVMRRRRNA
jgi:hypothetical protein